MSLHQTYVNKVLIYNAARRMTHLGMQSERNIISETCYTRLTLVPGDL
jgi:hypothetical protein